MYTNAKQWARVRHKILTEGKSIRSVSSTEHISRNTIKKMLLNEKPPGYRYCVRKAKVRTAPSPSIQTPKPTTAAQWGEWLTAVERAELQFGIDPKVGKELCQLMLPDAYMQRTKALVVLAYDHGFSVGKICAFAGISKNTVSRYLRLFRDSGIEGLFARKVRPRAIDNPALRESIFKLLHEPPSLSGINRSIWRLKDLRQALAHRGVYVGADAIRQVIKSAGYRWRSAKVVLTSTDPEYREKLAHVQSILSGLLPTERFFSIDEYGPFAIKMKAGRSLVGPSEESSVPQWQVSKGWLILTAALELSTNQVTHFYSTAKNTNEMIRMIGTLVEEYRTASKLYISWDAASWHMSKALVSYINDHNEVAAINSRPCVELAPLPASAQFLNVIESVFSGMARSIIHGSNYASKEAAIEAIDLYFAERNQNFRTNPRRAGNKIWGKERTPSEFSSGQNCKDPAYR